MVFILVFLFLTVSLKAMEPIHKKPLSKFQINNAFNKNTNYMIATHFAGIETVSVTMENDVSFVQSNIPDETFNYVFENRFSNDSVKTRIKQIAGFYKEKNVPWTWWISPGDTPEILEEKLNESGFIKGEEYNGMFCNINARITMSNLATVDCKRVRNVSQLKDFYTVNASEYFDRVWSKMSSKIFDDSSALEFYVGYVDQKPVTAALLVFHADIGGVYSVATDQYERKKGYASALMHFLLNRIEEKGYEYAALSASADVKKLYEKFGFQDMCQYRGLKKIQ